MGQALAPQSSWFTMSSLVPVKQYSLTLLYKLLYLNMKSAICTLLYCLIFSLLAKGQDYEMLIEKGDSLFKVKKFDSSFHTFEEALEAVSRLICRCLRKRG